MNKIRGFLVPALGLALVFTVLQALISSLLPDSPIYTLVSWLAPIGIDDYTLTFLCMAGINIIIALGLNLISGFTGQLALGQAGFMAVGAYSSAVLMLQFQWPLWLAILGASTITGVFGLLIGLPTLRLRGDYLAIVTLGFGEIIRTIIVNLGDLTGGAAGLSNIPMFDANIMVNNPAAFLWIFPATALAALLVLNLVRSSHGRALMAIRDDEISAQAMGVNIFGLKLTSFVISSVLAGLGGALYASLFGYLAPGGFNFLSSVFFVIIVVFGGMGSVTGTVLAGLVLTFLQEGLRANATAWGNAVVQLVQTSLFPGTVDAGLWSLDLNSLSQVLFGLTLVLLMIFRPQGLMGVREFSLVKLLFKTKKAEAKA